MDLSWQQKDFCKVDTSHKVLGGDGAKNQNFTTTNSTKTAVLLNPFLSRNNESATGVSSNFIIVSYCIE